MTPVSPGDFDERTVGAAGGDGDGSHGPVSEGEIDDGMRFDFAGMCVFVGQGADLGDISGEHEAQAVEAMNGDVADGAAGGEDGS